MLNRIKLGFKISGGFTIILILLIILSCVSYIALSSVEEKVSTANQFGNLVDRIFKARQNEKNFILDNDETFSQNVKTELNLLKKDALEISKTHNSEELTEQVNQIIQTSDDYSKAFESYVTLAGSRNELMADMNTKAQSALATTSDIRDSQKKAYDELRDQSELIVSEMRTRVVLANAMQSGTLITKGLRTAMGEIDDPIHHSFYTEWIGAYNDISTNLNNVKPMLKDADLLKMAEKIASNQKASMAAETLFF